MTAPTHIAFAEFLYLLLLTSTGVALSAVNAFMVGLTSLLPDLDSESTVMGRIFPFLSRRIERRFAHRTFTHSALCVVLFAIAASPLLALDGDLYACALAGLVSHPVLDTMTVNGVQVFYPFSRSRCVFPLDVNNPHRYRVKTGTRGEITLLAAFAFGCVPAFFVASSGHERFIRTTQRTVESALRDYRDLSRSSVVFAEVRAHSLLTKQQLAGVFEVAGALDGHTMLFRGSDGELRTLGAEYHAEYVAESVVCRPGPAVVVLVREIAMAGRRLVDVAGELETGPDHQIFGSLRTGERAEIPVSHGRFNPIMTTGDGLLFNHAEPAQIVALGLGNVLVKDGRLTVRTIFREEPEGGVTFRRDGHDGVDLSLVFAVGEGERLEYLCAVGDTVHADDLLARKATRPVAQEGFAVRQRELEDLTALYARQDAELASRIVVAAGGCREDSVAAFHARELHVRGFLSAVALEDAEQELGRSRLKLAHLRAERVARGRAYTAKTGELVREVRRLAEAAQAVRPTQELRSPVNGFVLDVRVESAADVGADPGANRTIILLRRW